jgi:hypothetical protein
MNTKLTIDFVWVPSDLGGHSAPPYVGMRTSIRWQAHLEEHLALSRDLSCEKVDYESSSLRGRLVGVLSVDSTPPALWMEENNLVELVSGYRVLAVGKITRSVVS